MNYTITSVIHLSLESFYNRGLTPEKAKEVIESISDPGGNLHLWCEPQALNYNWNVRTRLTNPLQIEDLVNYIDLLLKSVIDDRIHIQ